MDSYYEFLLKIQSIAKIGLLFSKDPYAIENYETLQELSHKMIDTYTGIPLHRPNLFVRDIYPTPNISVRTFVFDTNGRILLVKEKEWGTWSIPGGWCDLFESPSEAAKKEVLQESGYDVCIEQLLGITNRQSYLKNQNLCEYTICFRGSLTGYVQAHGHETTDVEFFALDHLPEISHKYTLPEIERILEAMKKQMPVFD